MFVDGEFPMTPAESGSLLHSTLVAKLHIFMCRSAYGYHVVLGCDGTRTGLDVILRRLILSLPGIETQPSILHASVVYLTASNFTDWPVMNNILLCTVNVVLFGISNSQIAADRPNNEAVTYPISLFSRVSILSFRALVSFLSRRTRIAGKSWYAQFSLFTWLSWWTSLSSWPLKTLSKKDVITNRTS